MFDREIWRRCRLFILIIVLTWVSYPSQAKTAGLTAVVVYPGNDGQNVAEISGFVLNTKNEVLQCGGPGKIERSAYHKLVKVQLVVGMSLERNPQGVLMLTSAGQQPACVVPGNLKLDKEDALSASALADRVTVEGSVLPGSDPPIAQIPVLKPGTLLVFVAAPNPEFANYLRADRQGDIPGWKKYLAIDATGSHAAAARKALSSLYLKAGIADFHEYTGSKGGSEQDFAKLAEARHMADAAHTQLPDDAATADLSKRIHAEVLDLSQQSSQKLGLYRDAVRQQTPGYANLVAAEHLANGAYLVEPSTPEAIAAEQQSKLDRAQFDGALRDSERQFAAGRPDEAARAIAPVRAFGPENSTVAEDLKSISGLYIARAKKSSASENWTSAISDFEKAQALVPSPDTLALLTSAQQQAQIAANKAAAQAAMQKSQDAEASGDMIRAYEVLDDLPPDQHGLVTERLQSLQEQYVQAAEAQAKTLQKAYEPINGTGDEVGIQKAYELSQRCFRLTEDPALHDQIDILAADLTTFYLKQGSKYADKPDGTGLNVAWAYLAEALQYSSQSNSGDVRDERERIRAKYRIKSDLSIRVEFRDSTSRRDSVGFATQLTDAMATGLESSNANVRVIRAPDVPPVPANFQLVGDVIQHDLGKQLETVPKQSKYKSGERQVTNPDWVKANSEFSQAKDDLQMARTTLQDAETRNKKKEIEAARKTMADDEQKVKLLTDKVSSLQQFNVVPVEDTYNYVERIVHVKPTIVIQFRILDSAGNEVVPEIPVSEESPYQYSQLDGVQPTDTQGVHYQAGFQPDDADFYRKSEYAAQDLLVQQAKAKVAGLPAVVLAQADHRVTDGDFDGAAEDYILYLNSTPAKDTPDRARAKAFLLKQFDFGDLALKAPSA